MADEPRAAQRHQTLIGAGALLLGGLMAAGASQIPSAAGYAGVGPNFLPWVVALVLMACGAGLVLHARSGGWREMEAPSGAPRGDWLALGWVAAGVLANAALLTTIGFIFSCTLCFMLAVRGLRHSEGKAHGGGRGLVLDFVTGFLIAAPSFWLFTKGLGINLPGLTATGWL
ncbi:MAG TPA: tripartite tricarboxylate transporter TctB family protein [Rubrivivax sp.]|jgi:putative tricarboxylic transport membrane protein|nr:tripartite tricarboxylate transporter TctB family protein [Rubrivivax sp.]